MHLQRIRAVAHPEGHRIDLSWVHPELDAYPGVRVVRRVGTHPALNDTGVQPLIPSAGVVVADVMRGDVTEVCGDRYVNIETGASGLTDRGLKSETVYYYTLYPFAGEPPVYAFDAKNRTAALATGQYDLAGRIYELLPNIYYRYDTVQPPRESECLSAKDRDSGQLRRFLDLPGGELDRLYSAARAALDLHNVARVDGALLPLLAKWIGWQTDFRLELDAQRAEIRNAPHIYQTIGIVPTVEATVKRVLGWESRSKEFVHNVFRTNTPERLHLWSMTRTADDTWAEPTAPLSLDEAWDGRATVLAQNDGAVQLFYHTLRQGRSDLCSKLWHPTTIEDEPPGWQPSETNIRRRDNDRHPVAVQQGDTVWLFWNVYDAAARRWRIDYRTRPSDASTNAWSTVNTFFERKSPWATLDNAESANLWLFWLEKTIGGWRLCYNLHDGIDWKPDAPLSISVDANEAEVYHTQDDLFATSASDDSLWLFWVQHITFRETGETRWRIAYRVKNNSDLDTSEWSEVRLLPGVLQRNPIRNPFALFIAEDEEDTETLGIYWRDGKTGATWHGALDPLEGEWSTQPAVVTEPNSAYGQRSAMVIAERDEVEVGYRWDTFDANLHRWPVDLHTRAAGTVAENWSPVSTFYLYEYPNRKRPWAVVEHAEPAGLWLFWLEEAENRWQLHYSRHDASGAPSDEPIPFPPTLEGEMPRVQDDLFAAILPNDSRLWLFWARQIPTGEEGQTRWQIAYRIKSNLLPDDSGWGAVRSLPDVPTGTDAREPFAIINDDDSLDLFWSSNETGSWSIWHGRLDATEHTWQTPPTIITGNPYNQRNPTAFVAEDVLHLIYRANDSIAYTSSVYSATETVDARYAGSTTAHSHNEAKNSLRGSYEDFQTYTYDAGQNGIRTQSNWYARDTVGVYLTPNTDDPVLIERNQAVIESTLRQFLPINVRTVFIIEPSVRQDYVYPTPGLPADRYTDQLQITMQEALAGVADGHSDVAPDWSWLESWHADGGNRGTVDTTADPIDRSTRTLHTGIDSTE